MSDKITALTFDATNIEPQKPTPFLPLSEPHFSPSCAPTRKSNFLAKKFSFRGKFAAIIAASSFLAFSNQSFGAIVLDWLMWAGSNADGTTTYVYNTTHISQYGSWCLFVENSITASGNFINNNESESGITVPLTAGSYNFSFAGDSFELDQSNRYFGAIILHMSDNLSNEGWYMGAWAPMNTSGALQAVPQSLLNTFFSATENVSLQYSNSGYRISLTDYMYSKDGILGYQDWASPYTVGPDGRTDTVGRVSFNVEAIPEPSVVASGMIGLVLLLGRTRRPKSNRAA